MSYTNKLHLCEQGYAKKYHELSYQWLWVFHVICWTHVSDFQCWLWGRENWEKSHRFSGWILCLDTANSIHGEIIYRVRLCCRSTYILRRRRSDASILCGFVYWLLDKLPFSIWSINISATNDDNGETIWADHLRVYKLCHRTDIFVSLHSLMSFTNPFDISKGIFGFEE